MTGLVGHGTGIRQKTVLEIGSGTGLVGLVAAGLGAESVIVTDLGHLVPFLDRNIRLNGLAEVVSAVELEWGNMSHISSVLKRLNKTITACSIQEKDGSQSHGQPRRDIFPDLILGSDLIYKVLTWTSYKRHFEPIISYLRSPCSPAV
jgi:predicted nicotinamide N-methyase